MPRYRNYCANENCENHKGWDSRVEHPKFCPRCKRPIPTTDELQAKTKRQLENLPQVKQYESEGFIPTCQSCYKAASFQYKKIFYCAKCLGEILMKEEADYAD